MKKLVFILLLFSKMIYSSNDTVVVYPAPESIKSSEKYKVAVEQNGKRVNSFVYFSTPLDNDQDTAEKKRHEVINGINSNQELLDYYFGGEKKSLDSEQSVAWTCFSFEGNIIVRVNPLFGEIKSFKILPTSKGIEGNINDGVLEFSIDEPKKLAIVINGDYLNPLFLFADALETDKPKKNISSTLVMRGGENYAALTEEFKKASVIWFEPGIHEIGVGFEVYSNQTIYIEGGAYLLGTIHGYMADNVVIRGRGILAGDNISRAYVLELKKEVGYGKKSFERMKYHSISMLSKDNKVTWNTFADHPGKGCDNLYIEGITIASPRQFFIRASGVPITIHNVKMVGSWPFNTDGISTIGQAYTTVYDCFFHCNDDAIYVNPNFCNIHHNTFWQGQNGNVFQLGWGGEPVLHKGGYIHDCDIIHVGHVSEANNRMVIGSRRSGPGDITDIYFKNINIEGPVWSIFRFETNGGGDNGSIYDIKLENISVNGPVINKSTIISSKGKGENENSTSWVRDITFKNVTINGRPINEDDFIIGDFQVKNIYFEE